MKTVNVVATVQLSTPVSLERIAEVVKGTEFAASGARWLKMRLNPEGYYVAFYRSGKFLVTGVRSGEEAEQVANRVLSVLKNADVNVDMERPVIENIVVTETLGLDVSLENLIYYLDSRKATYEPEQFPGLLYKDWGATFLIFPNGKTVITGVKEEKEAERVIGKLKNMLKGI